MNIQITSDNVEISESMKTLAVEKLSKLEKHLKDIPEEEKSYRIVMNAAPDQQFEVKIEAIIRGDKFFSERCFSPLETTLVEAIEELDRQLERSKFGSEGWEEKRETKRFPVDEPEVL